jgi:ferredoxin-NADP reductase
MLPDNVLTLINPLWSTRETRARVERIQRTTADSVTITLRPGRPVAQHEAGQHVRVGVDIEGVRHWRTYSLTSPAYGWNGTIEITAKAIPGGLVSGHLVRDLQVGDLLRIDGPYGEFVLPPGPMPKVLFLTAGSGITPAMGMLRTMAARTGRITADVVMIHSALRRDDVIFGAELRALTQRGLKLHEQHTDEMGLLSMRDLDTVCPDWREREVWACGPAGLLDAAAAHWAEQEVLDRLHVERFTPVSYEAAEVVDAEVQFEASAKSMPTTGAETLLDLGEQAGVLMPNGCRMGICFTCVVPLKQGRVRDTRTGEVHGEPGDLVQTCVSTACSDTILEI